MATQINELTNKATPVSTDEFPIQETGGGTTKKATLGAAFGAGINATFGTLAVGVNGVDVNPGADIDADLITVGVTGTPKLIWDESEDEFNLSKGLALTGDLTPSGGIYLGGTAAANMLDNVVRNTSWTPTVTANSNCSLPAISSATYTQIGDLVACEIAGTVTVTSTGAYTSFKFTVPVAMRTSAAKPGGTASIITGGSAMVGQIVEWTGANATEVGLIITVPNNTLSGSCSFEAFFTYLAA